MSFFTYPSGGGGAFPNLPSRKFYALIRGGYHVIPWKGEGVSPFDINPSGGFSFWCHLIEGGIPSWCGPFGGFPSLQVYEQENTTWPFYAHPGGGGCSLQPCQSPMTSPWTVTHKPHLHHLLGPPTCTIQRFCHSSLPRITVVSPWCHHFLNFYLWRSWRN